VLLVGLSACSGSTAPTTSAPTARIKVTIDDRQTAVAILAASKVTVDARASTGFGALTFDIDFGDGTSHVASADPTHVYAASGTFKVVARVTDSTGRIASATHEVVVQSVEGAWSHSAVNPQTSKTETRWLTIASQNGLEVRGLYFASSAQLDRRFTGTLGENRSLRLVLEDQTVEFNATVPDTLRAAGTEMLVQVRGGTAGGATLPFVPVFEGQHPQPDDVVLIRGLEPYVPFALPHPGVQWITLSATKVVNGVWEDCTAGSTWESSNPEVARFGTGAFGSSLDARRLQVGTTTLRVACGGLTGIANFEVARWILRLRAGDAATGQPLPGVDLVYGEGHGRRSDASGEFADLILATPSHTIWMWRPGYEFLERSVAWNRDRIQTETLAMTRTRGALLLEGDVLDRNASYDFAVPRAGTLQLTHNWDTPSDCCAFRIRLYCDGAVVLERLGPPGLWTFAIPVAPSCSYRLTFTGWNGSYYPVTLRFGAVLLD
jgi:PKD repeat protein